MQEVSSWMKHLDLRSMGREVGARQNRTVRTAISAIFALVGMTSTGSALAQGGICLSNCGDGGGYALAPIVISAFIGAWDPCDGGWCNNGGGNDDPPDEGGSSGGGSIGNGGASGGGGKVRTRGYNAYDNCSVPEELRLGAANVIAHGNVMAARRGDYVDVLLTDGMVERWQYICGGSLCGGTIINVSPVHSMCNGDWNWIPFADWEP